MIAAWTLVSIRDSIVVSISACHAEDPGSIPGREVNHVEMGEGIGGESLTRLMRTHTLHIMEVAAMSSIVIAETEFSTDNELYTKCNITVDLACSIPQAS